MNREIKKVRQPSFGCPDNFKLDKLDYVDHSSDVVHHLTPSDEFPTEGLEENGTLNLPMNGPSTLQDDTTTEDKENESIPTDPTPTA